MSEDTVVLGDLEPTRGLTTQMTAISSLGFVVGFGVFGALFQLVAGAPPSFQFASRVAWWTDALDLGVIAVLATAFAVPHELLHGLAIRYYGGKARYGVGGLVGLVYALARSYLRVARH